MNIVIVVRALRLVNEEVAGVFCTLEHLEVSYLGLV